MENKFSHINDSVLKLIGTAYENNDYRVLKQLGLSDTQMNRLNKMSMSQILRFKSLTTSIAVVTIDPRHFELCMNHVENESNTDEIKNEMIKMDASAAMLEALTGMDIIDFRARRVRLGLSKASQGRPASLTADESIIVSQAWLNNDDIEDELMHYYKVGLETNIPLNKIWAYMKLDQ